jgi:predicted permease
VGSLQASFNIVVPIIFLMLFGWVLRQRNILPLEVFSGINKFCSSVIIPVLLFYNTYTIDFSQAWNPRFIGFALASVIVLCAAGYFVMCFIEKNPARRSVMVLSVFRSNYLIFAIIIATTLCGDAGAGPVTMLSALVIPLMNILCILILEIGRAENIRPIKLILGFFKNPYLLSAVLGFAMQMLPFRLPEILQNTLRDVSNCFTPLSVITLGGLFKIHSVKQNIKNLVIVIFFRLILIPAIMLPIVIALGFRGPEFAALMSMFIAPVAISLFSMSAAMGGDSELSGQIILFSSVISIFTIFVWIYLITPWI